MVFVHWGGGAVLCCRVETSEEISQFLAYLSIYSCLSLILNISSSNANENFYWFLYFYYTVDSSESRMRLSKEKKLPNVQLNFIQQLSDFLVRRLELREQDIFIVLLIFFAPLIFQLWNRIFFHLLKFLHLVNLSSLVRMNSVDGYMLQFTQVPYCINILYYIIQSWNLIL